MDAMPPLAISSVLRAAAELKVGELNHARKAFIRRYSLDTRRSAGPNTVTRVKALIEDVSKFNPELVDDDDLEIMRRYVEQAQDDRSIPESKILKFEERICNKLGKHLNRLEVSALHVELMEEVMDAEESAASVAAKLDSIELDDDFEVVESELDEVLEKFEKETFTADEMDVEAIEAYLSSLFVDQGDKRELEQIRSGLRLYSEDVEADGVETDQDFLMWCIVDLLKNESIADDKKKVLQGYLQSPIALRELVSTINMKSVRSWEYKNAENGLPITAHQTSEGQHCISMEEDIIDMLFLHSMGYGWAMKLKNCLVDFAQQCKSFDTEGLSRDATDMREYFLGRNPSKPIPPVATPSVCTACHPYYPPAPMPPPPPMPMNFGPPPPPVVVIDWPGKKKDKSRRSWIPVCPPPASLSNLAGTRNSNYRRDFFMSRLPILEGCTPKTTPAEEVQADMMKTLAAEAKLREAFDGLVYAGTAKLESLASSLPHKVFLTVLKFLGVSEISLGFFERFLSAKLNIGPAVRGAPDRVLPRARGVPEGHALELFFTEAIMFFLELVIHQKTGSYLYRLKDSCYFVGNYDQHDAFEAQVADFAEKLGLQVSFRQTQAIGFLDLATPFITIEDNKVVQYARRVKKQLSACTTMLDWVRVWNSTAGTYAAHLFGPLADVFGKSHLDTVRSAYRQIFEIILDDGNLTTHIRNLLSRHVKRPLANLSFSLEAFIYLPQPYGGLGVKNPFVTLNLAHDLHSKPDDLITKYLEVEDTYYKRAAENWALLPADAHARKVEVIFENNNERVAASLGTSRDTATFMTKDELTEHRERTSYPSLPIPPPPAVYTHIPVPSLTSLYAELLNEPNDDIPSCEKVSDDVRRLSGKGDMKSWNKLSGEDKWVLQLYGDECFERYGGLEMWVGEFVPQEVLKAVRGASWDDDDETSYGSYDEP